jgi:hypothetical protein
LLWLREVSMRHLDTAMTQGVAMLCGASDNNAPDINHDPPPVRLVRRRRHGFSKRLVYCM